MGDGGFIFDSSASLVSALVVVGCCSTAVASLELSQDDIMGAAGNSSSAALLISPRCNGDADVPDDDGIAFTSFRVGAMVIVGL